MGNFGKLSSVFVYSWATVIQLELSRGRLSVVGRWSSWWHLSFSALMASHILRLLLLQRLFRCATERERKKKEDETLCSWRKTSSFFLSYRFAPHGWVDELGTKLTAWNIRLQQWLSNERIWFLGLSSNDSNRFEDSQGTIILEESTWLVPNSAWFCAFQNLRSAAMVAFSPVCRIIFPFVIQMTQRRREKQKNHKLQSQLLRRSPESTTTAVVSNDERRRGR